MVVHFVRIKKENISFIEILRNSFQSLWKSIFQLAANADYSVAMTDDDKKRLAELLEGVDELPEFEEPLGEDSLVRVQIINV